MTWDQPGTLVLTDCFRIARSTSSWHRAGRKEQRFEKVVSMADLEVVRLLQNPLGQRAPEGERGDIVRVSDGTVSLYLLPWEYDLADGARLQWLLAQCAIVA